MKKLLLTSLILFMLLIPVEAEVLSVCQDCEYTEIQAALLNSTDGDVIQIGPGTYEENLFVDKSVKIVGSDSGRVIIQPLNWGQPTLSIVSENVSLEGLTLTNGFTALKTTWADNISVVNCSVQENHYGMWLGSNEHKIAGNNFEENNIHIYSTNSFSLSIHQNEFAGGKTGISFSNSGFNNITENSLNDVRIGIQLESSSDNFIHGNDFSKCSNAVQAVFSGGNNFSHNRADNALLDLQISSQNIMVQNKVEGVYARDRGSFSNLYLLNGYNLTGNDFQFSLLEPSISEYVTLGDAVNITLIDPAESSAYMEASIPAEDLDGIDLTTTGFYELEDEVATLISAGILKDGELMVNASINNSGNYVLLGKEGEAGSVTTGAPETTETPPDIITRLIVSVVVLMAAVLLLTYMYKRR